MAARTGKALVLTPEEYHKIETWQPGAGRILKEWRESRGWTQKRIADKVLTQDNLICQWEAEKKRPTGQRLELLLATIAPRNIVRVSEQGYITGQDLESLLAQIRNEHELPIERQFHLLDGNMDKILMCLILKCSGTIMPGVDVSALKIYFDRYDKTREQFELMQSKHVERVSSRGRKWLESSLSSTPSADVVTSNPSESIVDEPSPTTE